MPLIFRRLTFSSIFNTSPLPAAVFADAAAAATDDDDDDQMRVSTSAQREICVVENRDLHILLNVMKFV